MINLHIEHANPVWDRHIVVSSDEHITDLLLGIKESLEKKKDTITCYGFSQLDNGPRKEFMGAHYHTLDFEWWRKKTINERIHQSTEYCKNLFAFTIFGEAKNLVAFVKELEKEITIINNQTKRR